eukprot:1175546-Prorocentrum_minimum.AAC.1
MYDVPLEEGVGVVRPDEIVHAGGDVERRAGECVGGERHHGEALRHLDARARGTLRGGTDSFEFNAPRKSAVGQYVGWKRNTRIMTYFTQRIVLRFGIDVCALWV